MIPHDHLWLAIVDYNGMQFTTWDTEQNCRDWIDRTIRRVTKDGKRHHDQLAIRQLSCIHVDCNLPEHGRG